MWVSHHRWGKRHITECAAFVLIHHIGITSLPGRKKKITLETTPSPKISCFPFRSIENEIDHKLFIEMSSFRSAISFFPHDNYHRNLVTDFNPYLFSTATARHWEYRINMQIWVTWRKMGLIIRREHIVSGKQSLIAPVILIKVGKISEFKWPELFSRNYILTFSSAFDQF